MERKRKEIVVHSYLGTDILPSWGKKVSFVLTDLSKRKDQQGKSRFRAFIAFSCLGRSLGGTIPYMFKGMMDAPTSTQVNNNKRAGLFSVLFSGL